MHKSSTVTHASVAIPRGWLVMGLAALSWVIVIAAWQSAFATFNWLLG